MFSLCMGSRPGGQVDAEGLTTLDRHEVAHTVITSLNSPKSRPPALLVEGWAEANQGTDPTEQAIRVWEKRTSGDDLTLRELTGPDWYWRSLPDVYVHGAPLVNYLLRRFGPERFLALYTTCDFPTFADDCQRTLGVSLDQLNHDFWTNVERTVAREGSHPQYTLARLKLGPGVDPELWKAFLDDYFGAAKRLLAPHEHVNMTTEFQFTSTDDQGNVDHHTQHLRLARSGKLVRARVKWNSGEMAYLAHPKKSFVAQRKTPNDPWEIEDDPNRDPDRAYRRTRDRIDDLDTRVQTSAILLQVAYDLNRRYDTGNIVVAGFERFTENGHPFVRVRLENPSKDETSRWRTALFVLAVDQLFAVQNWEYIRPGAAKETYRGDSRYEVYEGIPILSSFQTSGILPTGKTTLGHFKVVDRNFEPLPEEEFTLERLLEGSSQRTVISHDFPRRETGALIQWYWVPLVLGLICLVAGFVTCLLGWLAGRRRLEPNLAAT